MKIAYKPKAFRASSLGIIEVANRIIESYAEQGFDLIVRQLYYQFIAQDLFPDEWFDEKAGSKNSERNYKRLGKVVNDARLAGLVHWETLVDRTRPVVRTPTWENPADVIRSAHESFRIDFWEDQPHYVEVWVEKEALMGVVGRACSEWRVPHLACRGYTSQSAQWRSAQRMVEATDRGKTVTVLHLGDHDPSGIDMTRDNEERLWLLSGGADIQVHRLALNVPQVERYQPPPNPTKLSDTRARGIHRTLRHGIVGARRPRPADHR